jgi:hypothetical protein
MTRQSPNSKEMMTYNHVKVLPQKVIVFSILVNQ